MARAPPRGAGSPRRRCGGCVASSSIARLCCCKLIEDLHGSFSFHSSYLLAHYMPSAERARAMMTLSAGVTAAVVPGSPPVACQAASDMPHSVTLPVGV